MTSVPRVAADAPSSTVVVTRATTAAAVTALFALLVLLLALRWPILQRPGLGLLLGVPLVRNAFLGVGLRGRDRALAVVGAALLVIVGAVVLGAVVFGGPGAAR
jgi:hypothetical protein